MRSPFQIFRKYQKESIVILVGMAMFAFIFLDAVAGMDQLPPVLWVVLLAMLLAGVFWVVGNKVATKSGKFNKSEAKSKAVEYGLAGALLGAAIGVALMMFTREPAAIVTTAGKITEKQLREMVEERRKAVTFMQQAYTAGNPPADSPSMEWMQGLNNATFGFRPVQMGRMGPIQLERDITKRDVVYKYLLLQEAKEYGIRVGEDAVKSFIARLCKGLTPAAYDRIRQKLGLSQKDVVRIIGEELAARVVVKLKTPRHIAVSAPLDYWEQYTKYNVSERLELVELPVEDFTAKVPDPKESDLQAFFDKYKENEPSEIPSPDPAFKLPQRVQVAYFQPDAVAIRKEIVEKLRSETVPASERQAELKRIADAVAEVEKKIESGEIKKDDAERERLLAKQRELYRLLKHGEPTRLQYEIVKYYEENKDREFANPNWAKPHPGDGKEKPEGGPELKKREPVRAPRPKRAKKNANEKAKPAGKSGALRMPARRNLLAVAAAASPWSWTSLLLQPKSKSKPKPKKKADAKAKPEAQSKSKKPDDSKKPAGKKQAKTKAQDNPFEKTEPEDEEIQSPPPPPEPVDPLSPFQPLDETSWEAAKRKVIDGHLTKEITQRMSQAAAAMEKVRDDYLKSVDAKTKFDNKTASETLKAAAKEIGLEYHVLPVLGAIALKEDPAKYPIGNAAILPEFGRPFLMAQNLKSVVDELFPSNRTQSADHTHEKYKITKATGYGPHPQFGQFAVEPKIGESYLFWKTAHLDAKVPKFEDEGIREKVLKAWKMKEARALAKQRGEALAEIARTATKPMETVFEDQTVTGDADGNDLSPKMTGKIAWQQIQYQRQQSRIPTRSIPRIEQIVTPPIPYVPDAGEEFRETIFRKLADGEVGVVPNAAKSRYYVVRVFDRNPTTDEGRRGAMKNFVKEEDLFNAVPAQFAFQSPYFDANSPENLANQKIHAEIRDALYKKYDVKIDVPLDER